MAEVITIPTVSNVNHDLGEAVVAQLVKADRLPADIYFRSLIYDERADRSHWVSSIVLDELGLADEPVDTSLLSAPLPDCVYVPGDPDLKLIKDILVELDDDYYQLADLTAANHLTTKDDQRPVWQIWARMIRSLNEPLLVSHKKLLTPGQPRGDFDKQHVYKRALTRTVCRDAAVLRLFNGGTFSPDTQTHDFIGTMLTDNHPEIAETLFGTRP